MKTTPSYYSKQVRKGRKLVPFMFKVYKWENGEEKFLFDIDSRNTTTYVLTGKGLPKPDAYAINREINH